MGIFSKLLFWKKEELPDLPEETPSSLTPPPLDVPQEEPRKPFTYPEPPKFDESPIQQPQQASNNEFQVISSKLDVLNAKIEVLNEKISNLERNLQDSKIKW
ncbi:MAG: hypothetical protein CMH62_00720 [Nanoarchaeota archaeon]|nr:hypothetical protein [Nanoarchaeota archaeon]|tara:strand:+ start:811 stop:1116 length:306 start_codon:yes stop_codon:yes gene_type:complete